MYTDPTYAAQGLTDFNYQMALMSRSYQETKLNDNAARNFGKDATPELARFEIFYSPGGAAEQYIRDAQMALLNPNPSKSFITYEEALGNE